MLSGFAPEERVAKYSEGPGIGLSFGTSESVDWFTDFDVDKADLFEHELPACTRQATCDSTSP